MTQRERFEAWAKKRGLSRAIRLGVYTDERTLDAWAAWQAACPEGWQAVPKEPDLAMIAALGWDGNKDLALGHAEISAELAEDFKAALSAAPKPGDV